MTFSLCQCGSKKKYENCCEPIHLDPTQAEYPEQLMRARYCAHERQLIDFIVKTYHPSCHAEDYRDAIIESVNSEWFGLEILNTSVPLNNEGFVEFKAYYQENSEGYCLHERSRFVKEATDKSEQWFYIDGEQPQPAVSQKEQRNDPCPCGSGKKHKKCCG